MKKVISMVFMLFLITVPFDLLNATPAELFGTNLIADIAERASPAVVSIESLQYVRTRRRSFRDPFFDKFFGHLFDDDFIGHNNVIPQKGNGSGVLISPEGYLLTNEHVISGADEIRVKLNSGKSFRARVIGKDSKTDLAVIKIDTNVVMPYIPIGDSSDMRVGEWVVAIGNPFGLGITVTTGVVSALNRDLSIDRERSYKDLIQTDASINPGNSGGALLNTEGHLIGINTAIMPSGQGIGFAIPVNLAKRIVGDLMTYGRVKKASLGITIQRITPELAAYFDIPDNGVLVARVANTSSAQKAGIVPGDVIFEINGRNVKKPSDFNRSIDEHRVGEKVKIGIFRKGKEGYCEVEFEENLTNRNMIGVTIQKINKEVALKYSLYVNQGCVITNIAENSPAARAGLRAGDVIQQINQIPTYSEKDFNLVIERLSNQKKIILRVIRGQTVNLLMVNVE